MCCDKGETFDEVTTNFFRNAFSDDSCLVTFYFFTRITISFMPCIRMSLCVTNSVCGYSKFRMGICCFLLQLVASLLCKLLHLKTVSVNLHLKALYMLFLQVCSPSSPQHRSRVRKMILLIDSQCR